MLFSTHDSLQHLRVALHFPSSNQHASELPPLLHSFLSPLCNYFCLEISRTQHIVFLMPEALTGWGKKDTAQLIGDALYNKDYH